MSTSNHDNEDTLQRADDARYNAMLAGDAQTLESLLADELVYTHSSAIVDNKSQYLDSVRNGNVKYIGFKRSNVHTRFYDNIAHVHGQINIEAVVGGNHKNLNNLFQAVWVKRDGRWQLLAWASTVIPAAS